MGAHIAQAHHPIYCRMIPSKVCKMDRHKRGTSARVDNGLVL